MSDRFRFFAVRLAALVTPVVACATLIHAAGPQKEQFQPAGTLVVEAPAGQDARPIGVPGENRRLNVIVQLEDAALLRSLDRQGLRSAISRVRGARRIESMSLEARSYVSELRQKQRRFEAAARAVAPRARFGRRLTVALNAVAVDAPEDEVSRLESLPGVKAVYLDTLQEPQTTKSAEFIGAGQIWNGQGGNEPSAGEGVVVGVIDSGVWPEHPSFADPDGSGTPYSVPAGWNGAPCEFGSAHPNDPPFSCNNKLLGARRIMATYDQSGPLSGSEFPSARDDNGHGTHMATTAAGNAGVSASIVGNGLGAVSGVAPRAHLAVYKACGTRGCFDSDAVAAVEQAILDGVDVIGYAISGGSKPYSDAVSLAFLEAYQAGIFVATAAGNTGMGTTGHLEPWTMTAASSTMNRSFQSTVTLNATGGRTLTVTGTSVTVGIPTATALVNAADFGDATCLTSGPATTFAGKVVICTRGGNTGTEKSFNVQQRGAVGMILINPSTAGTTTDSHVIPTVHLEKPAADQLLAFLALNSGESARFTAGAAVTVPGDAVASFSARGGASQVLGIAKPDVVAPGVQIVAGHTPMPAVAGGAATGQLSAARAGTSVSAAHVAGAAALLKSSNPGWSPGHLKSAMMLTALPLMKREDGVSTATPFDIGSGRLQLGSAADPGMAIAASATEFLDKLTRLWDANYPSLYLPRMPGIVTVQRTIENLRATETTWNLQVYSTSDVKVTVPASITIPPNATTTISINVQAVAVPLDHVRHAYVSFTEAGSSRMLIFPISLVRKPGDVPVSMTCTPTTVNVGAMTDCTMTVSNAQFTQTSVTAYGVVSPALQLQSVVNAVPSGNTFVTQATLAPAIPGGVDVRPGAPWEGFLNLSQYYPPISCAGSCDDRFFVGTVASGILYNGVVYTTISISSNGFVQLGGGTSAWPENRNMPDPAPPNNILAPFWTDLHPAGTDGLGGGQMYVGYVTYPSGRTWLVVEWNNVLAKGSAARYTFQVWLQVGGATEDITFSYARVDGNGGNGFLTVGAENADGSAGKAYYHNGTGALPAPNSNLTVSSPQPSAGGTLTVTFRARGQTAGGWSTCGIVLSSHTADVASACITGSVQP